MPFSQQELDTFQWVMEQERNRAIYQLYEKLRHGSNGDIVNVKTIPVLTFDGTWQTAHDFQIKIVQKYGLRWYAMRLPTQKRWKSGILIDNSALMDWCLHIEEREVVQ